MKTRTELAMNYHMDIKHNSFLDSHKAEKEKEVVVKIKEEPNEVDLIEPFLGYKCNCCEKSFLTEKGLRIHKGHVHKEQNGQKRDLECDTIKRVNSFSRSPPTKKSKEDLNKTEDSNKVFNQDQTLREKNHVVADLKKTIEHLKQELALKETKQNPLKPELPDTLNIFKCLQCNIEFKTNMELFTHNEKTHIHDN